MYDQHHHSIIAGLFIVPWVLALSLPCSGDRLWGETFCPAANYCNHSINDLRRHRLHHVKT
jgi:hypothetical protein